MKNLLLAAIAISLSSFCVLLKANELIAIIDSCDACHGKKGVSENPNVPTIAGYSAFYFDEAMKVYRDKARPCEKLKVIVQENTVVEDDMCRVSAVVSDATIAQLAEFYAKQSFKPAKQAFDPVKAKLGESIHNKQCNKCHSSGGGDPADDAGILAGQWRQYLVKTFEEYDSGKREQPKKMAVKYDQLDASSKEALIDFYVSQQ